MQSKRKPTRHQAGRDAYGLQGRTPQDFIRCLDAVLWVFQEYNASGKPWPKRLDRFNYWASTLASIAYTNLVGTDPLAGAQYERVLAFADPIRSRAMRVAIADAPRGAHKGPASWREQVEPSYRVAHENGDEKAIFQYARDDFEALRASWVVDQLIAWRLQGTASAKRKFERFMRAYWSRRGNRTAQTTLEIIARDQAIYRDFRSRESGVPRETAISTIADRHSVSVDTVKAVLKHYNRFYRIWQNTPLFPSPISPSPHH